MALINERRFEMKKAQNSELTMLASIAGIVSLAKGSYLSNDFFEKADGFISYLSERQGISKMQAVLLSLFIELGTDYKETELSDIASYLKCQNVQILQYANEVEGLVKMGLLHKKADCKGEHGFVVPKLLLDNLIKNEIYQKKSYKDASDFSIFQQIYEITHLRYEDELSSELLVEEVQRIFDENPSLPFVKSLRQTRLTEMDEIILAHMCRHLITDGTENVPINHISFLYDSRMDIQYFEHEMTRGTHYLITLGWIENAHADGFRDMESFRLTDKARETLLSNYVIQTTDRKECDVLHSQEITAKELFFGEQVSQQLNCLSELLSESHYASICSRLESKGLRKGFTCLFYGAPGTGKTESVFQLARQTGRDIMQVNISQVKSMWVGQSEKNIKQLFDQYRTIVKRTKIVPILLFNEADGVIGKRKQDAERSVDKMENSVQNIILQEMESLEGIMIATTNLVQNIDAAFERRFLYKIKFDKPELAQRVRIWQSLMPAISGNTANILASNYDFSGGQIENIARKCDVDSILYGTDVVNEDRIIQYCADECIVKGEKPKIGFV